MNQVFKKLDICTLFVPQEYQRDLNKAHVQTIVRNFQPSVARPPLVRKVGRRWEIIDGQHTAEAWKLIYGTDISITCQIIDTDKPELIFIALNTNVKKVTPADTFKALLRSGDKIAADVDLGVKAIGHALRVDGGRGPTSIEQFHKNSGPALYEFRKTHGNRAYRSMLAMLCEAFSRADGGFIERGAKQAGFINALNVLYASKYTAEQIFHGLCKWNMSAADIMQQAKANGADDGHSVQRGMASIMLRRVANRNRS